MRETDKTTTRRTRRSALGALGTGLALGLAGCTGGSNAGEDSVASADGEDSDDSTNPSGNGADGGALVVVYDDGPIEDVEKALPVHREFDAPATAGIVSEWVGRDGYMGTDELDTLVSEGWEIASHTREHTTVGAFRLVDHVQPSDTTISADGYRLGHHSGKEIEISDGRKSTRCIVEGLAGEPGDRSIEVEEPIGESFDADDSEVRYPPETMRDMLRGSKEDLEAMGYDVETLLAPYDVYTGWSDLFVPEEYAGVCNARHGSRVNLIDEFGLDPYATHRDYFAEFTSEEAVRDDLDTIVEEDALGVVGCHSHKDEVTDGDIRSFLSDVEERGIEVITLREAIERYGQE